MSEHTKEPFKREPRYVVFKIKDCIDYLSGGQVEFLEHIGAEIAAGRRNDGCPPFNAVVVEQDWPEFDLVWEMIEARMIGKGNDANRFSACVDACEGIPTEFLKLPEVFSKHRIHEWIELQQQRDKLLAALKESAQIVNKLADYGELATVQGEWRDLIAEVEAGK